MKVHLFKKPVNIVISKRIIKTLAIIDLTVTIALCKSFKLMMKIQ